MEKSKTRIVKTPPGLQALDVMAAAVFSPILKIINWLK